MIHVVVLAVLYTVLVLELILFARVVGKWQALVMALLVAGMLWAGGQR